MDNNLLQMFRNNFQEIKSLWAERPKEQIRVSLAIEGRQLEVFQAEKNRMYIDVGENLLDPKPASSPVLLKQLKGRK